MIRLVQDQDAMVLTMLSNLNAKKSNKGRAPPIMLMPFVRDTYPEFSIHVPAVWILTEIAAKDLIGES